MSVTVCLFIHCHSQYVLILISFSNSTINFWNLCGRTWKKNSEQTSHRKGNCTLVGQWMYIGLLMNYVWTWEMSMISNQLSEVQPPDTVRAALSGIQKKRLAEGEGGLACENARGLWWKHMAIFQLYFFFRETRFETWTKILSLKHGHVMENDKFFEDIFFF